MSLILIVVLIVLMSINQIIGTSYGSWKVGFKKDLLISGLLKITYLALGYGALAFAVHFAAQYVPSIEYLNGILVEPIAKYFTKICDSLRRLLDEPVVKNVDNDD